LALGAKLSTGCCWSWTFFKSSNENSGI
jgi:hypothetical protein